MRTETVKIYTFSELSEEAQEKAIKRHYGINVYYDWYNHIYDDANRIGLKLTGFGTDRDKHANGEFIDSPYDVAQKIIAEHGDTCDTYQTAQDYISDWNSLVEKYSDGIDKDVVTEGNEYEFDQWADQLEEDFLKDLLSDYANMLQKESDRLMSDEAIKETLIDNEYEFTEDGEMY